MVNTKNIATNIEVCIYAYKRTKTPPDNLNELFEMHRKFLKALDIAVQKPKGDNSWYFYERYSFLKENINYILSQASLFEKFIKDSKLDMHISVDFMYNFEECGEITLGDKVRISDPCYDMETWCAGTLNNVLPGIYKCYSQKTHEGRVAAIKVVHENYNVNDCEMIESSDIKVGVDSGMCGIYDNKYFADNCKNEDWYEMICDLTYAETFEDKAFVSSSGYGDGGYSCYVYRNNDGQIAAIEICYIDFDN